MVRAIFLDIDGTLRDERTGVPPSAARAIRLCRQKGIRVILCTGRNLASIQQDVRDIETDGVIAGGGCLTVDGGEIFREFYFQYEEIREPVRYGRRTDLPFAMESQEKIFMNRAAGHLFQTDFEKKLAGLGAREKEQKRRGNGICYRDNMGEFREREDRIHKLCLWSPVNAGHRLAAAAERIGTAVQQGEWGGLWYLELLPPGCTKGAAVRDWCRYRGIDPADTVSFGDGRNDIDMLAATGVGVAMADGDRELKRRAAFICGPAAEDGIYRELVRQRIID